MTGYTLNELKISGRGLILAEGFFGTSTGKTANGLVRYSRVLKIVGVIDSQHAGKDAGTVLDGKCANIPIFSRIEEAIHLNPDWLIIGVASIGGRLPSAFRPIVISAIKSGINILSGLHEWLAMDPELKPLAEKHGVRIVDIRRPRPLHEMNQYSALAEKIGCARIPVLGTDGSIGKRTTALILYHALRSLGVKVEFVATGQTGLLQGAEYGVPLDSILGDYMVGELESEIFRAWKEKTPEVILVEGQGSISHPAYVCGSRAIICALKPTGIILQHAPGRKVRNFGKGKIDIPMPKVEKEIELLEIYSGAKTIAITINHENMTPDDVKMYKKWTREELGIPSWDVLVEGGEELALLIKDVCKKMN